MTDEILSLQLKIDALDYRLDLLESKAKWNIASAASLLGRMTSDKKAAAAKKNGAKRWKNHVKKAKP